MPLYYLHSYFPSTLRDLNEHQVVFNLKTDENFTCTSICVLLLGAAVSFIRLWKDSVTPNGCKFFDGKNVFC